MRGSTYRKAVCVLLAKALRRRVVLHVHSGPGDVATFRAGSGRPSLALLRRAFARADVVLAVSAASAEALRGGFGVRGEIEVVPNAAPPPADFERAEPAGGRGPRSLYLGGFANPVKGGEVLVEALTAARPRSRGCGSSLAGPGRAAGAASGAARPRAAVA